MEWDGLAGLPIFDEDLEDYAARAGRRSSSTRSRSADALLIATPEYNASLPGALKNALDWASRPFPDNVLRDKPTAVIGASTGLFGAVWAQAEVRKALKASGAHVLESELPVGMADGAFDRGRRARRPRAGRAARRPRSAISSARWQRRSSNRHDRSRARPSASSIPARRRASAPTRPATALRILAAATELVEERGIERVSMDDVARAACVGTGTLYRRFGDRAGLALALLDEHTREFQDALISGPPPLGPGVAGRRAPARVRRGLPRPARAPRRPARRRRCRPARGADGGPYALYATHLAILLREAAPHARRRVHRAGAARDAAPGAAPLRAARRSAGRSSACAPGWHALVDALTV